MLNLIFVLETTATNKSDWMYVKSVLDYYYGERTSHLHPIYAKSKSKLTNVGAKIKREIENAKGKTVVIICADCDEHDEVQNDKIKQYCEEQGYELVWMNRDIEDVFWAKKANNKEKEDLAVRFQTHKDKLLPKLNNLNSTNPLNERRSTNILTVLDKYQSRKAQNKDSKVTV